MGIRSIQFLALAILSSAASLVAAQTTSLSAANECRLTTARDETAAVELAAMFTSNDDADVNVSADGSLFVYAVNAVPLESEGAVLVDVSDVTNCSRHKNII
jgi:hypothetical protein